MRLFKFLKYPYPFYENAKQGLKISVGIGVFISLFCYLFSPFGLNQLSDLTLLSFGMVSFLVCGFYIVLLPFLFEKQLRTKGWRIYKEILWILLINFSLAISNYFYLGYVFNAGYKFNISIFLTVFMYTLLIAVIPAIAIILYKQVFVYKKIVKEVEKIDAKLVSKNNLFFVDEKTKLIFYSENKNETIEVDIQNFLFLSSSGNYVEIFSIQDNEIKRDLIRNTISKLEKELKKHESIFRCHRSHIINLNKIYHIEGNLQGYQLYFNKVKEQIPVSRSYTKVIKELLLENR